MNFDWQNAAAAVLVLLACAYLARQGWLVLRRKRSSGCGGGCPKCADSSQTAGSDVVSIDLPDRQSAGRRP